MWSLSFILENVLLGVGLAMDAFSVSLANGLSDPHMPKRRVAGIAGVFGGFQFVMPMIGWVCVHEIAERFKAFQPYIPWIGFALLMWIGGKMLVESLHGSSGEGESNGASFSVWTLLVQGVGTSIDALSVGFTLALYNLQAALAASLIIGVVTFGICVAGLLLGRSAGTKLAGKAGIVGGCILIAIGIRLLISAF